VNASRLRSSAALLTILLFSALAGESVAWHDHPLEVRELAPYGISLVDHEGDYETEVHFDRGEMVRRPGCWACILASSPTEAAASPALLAGELEDCGQVEIDEPQLHSSPHPRPAVARGPPSATPRALA